MLSCLFVAGTVFLQDVDSDWAQAGERLVPFAGTTFQRTDRLATGYRGQTEKQGDFLIITPAEGPSFTIALDPEQAGLKTHEILDRCYTEAERR